MSMHEVDVEDRALLIIVDPKDDCEADANTEELILLAESAGVHIVEKMHVRRLYPDAKYYIGKGNAEEAYICVQDSNANVIIVSEDLSPTQQRNLEDAANVRVVDRTQLILDIFAQRARTSEGKLQVELAQLQYLLPRLSGKGAQMSRLGGASGSIATRGPGETKLEVDRRRIRKRISVLKDELENVVKHRSIQNRSRRKLLIPSAALVGYTSAGKSTLMNLLAGTEVYADEKLFATLDPTTRLVEFPNGHTILLSDTVGFVRNLPHHLIASFKATLEEVIEADFLIHVIDAAHHQEKRQREAVMQVLTELGAQDKPTITVFNKSDLVKDQYGLRHMVADTPNSCYMSALTGEGIEYLIRLIDSTVAKLHKRVRAVVPYNRGDLLAMAHERGRVLDTEHRPEGTYIEVELAPDLAARLKDYYVSEES